jgi:hypothetical protein
LGLTALVCTLSAPAAFAVPINYGNYVGINVSYLQVTEQTLSAGDADGLFGAPTVVGDQIDFDPVGFAANASGAGGNDITDVELTFGIQAKPNEIITTIILTEAGDYTIAGAGGAGTLAAVAANVIIEVFEVDGVALGVPVQTNVQLAFAPSDGDYNLADDGQTILGSWNGSLTFDVAAFLASESIDGSATRVQVTLDNQLVALSEDGTNAFIAKKDTDGLSVTTLPEPGAGILSALGLLGLAAFTRRQAS